MQITFDSLSGKLLLKFDYRRFLVESIKELPDRKYNPVDKSWLIGFKTLEELNIILAMLAGNSWHADQLNSIELEARKWVTDNKSNSASSNSSEYETIIVPDLNALARVLELDCLDGRITQDEYGRFMRIIQHLQIKDFVVR